ncbi:MAG: ComEA family DNA-binding protein [Microbacteriaceae bacterium]
MTVPIEPRPLRARLRVGVGAAIVVVLVALGSAVFIAAITPQGTVSEVAPASEPGADGAPGQPPGEDGAPSPSPGAPSSQAEAVVIFVHVLGAVHTPGLYTLADGARAVDAVAAAGGFTDTAERGGVNLARFVSDGEQLYVPAVGEATPPGGPGPPGALAPGAAAPGKVNLNTADLAALDTLPRVGPALAERIIQWRDTNGRFLAVEDLMSVSGIGQKTFEGLRDLVTV